MAYVIYDKETTRYLTVQWFATVPAAKAAITRSFNSGKIRDKRKYAVAEVNEFHENIEKKVERTNLMTGKKFFEPINTPIYCSPAFESYWSM